MANKWAYAIFLVIGLAILSFLIAAFVGVILQLSPTPRGTGNVLLISMSGPIVSQPSQTLFGTEPSMSDFIINNLNLAARDPSIKAVVLSIDSPGGGAVASHEVVEAMNQLDKPTVAVIRSLGASGAYWVASAADVIFANRLSMLGSIGVTSVYLEFSGLLENYNVTYERLVSGEFKDVGSPFRSLRDEERDVLQRQLDRVHQIFKDDVARNRNLTPEQIDYVSDGKIFLGDESIELGLIDYFGNVDSAKTYLESELNMTVRFREARKSSSMFPLFGVSFDNFAFNFGKGFASWLTQESTDEIISLN